MKAFLLLPYLCILSLVTAAQSRADLQVPDRVVINPQAAFTQHPGTLVYFQKPAHYHITQEGHYRKNGRTYIAIQEMSGTRFSEIRQQILQWLAAAKKSAVPAYYAKEFILGDQPALIIYISDTIPGQHQLGLYFGNQDRAIMAYGTMPANDTASRSEILHTLLTTHFLVKEDGNYTVDLTNSPFYFAGNEGNQYFYALRNDHRSASGDGFMIEAMAPMTLDARQKLVEDMTQKSKPFGATIVVTDAKFTTINGNDAYEATFTETFGDIYRTTHIVLMGNDRGSALFYGVANRKNNPVLQQMKEVAGTLRMK